MKRYPKPDHIFCDPDPDVQAYLKAKREYWGWGSKSTGPQPPYPVLPAKLKAEGWHEWKLGPLDKEELFMSLRKSFAHDSIDVLEVIKTVYGNSKPEDVRPLLEELLAGEHMPAKVKDHLRPILLGDRLLDIVVHHVCRGPFVM